MRSMPLDPLDNTLHGLMCGPNSQWRLSVLKISEEEDCLIYQKQETTVSNNTHVQHKPHINFANKWYNTNARTRLLHEKSTISGDIVF